MQLGIEKLLNEKKLQQQLSGKRIALVGHPASVTSKLIHSLDALVAQTKLNISAAFGPQHGMRGDKQDNMIETDNYVDAKLNIPVFSLYGDVRRPDDDMMNSFDVALFDVQDLGCRIYTYITTLLYLLEACATHNKTLWVLDRPNPAGRHVEGNLLLDGWQSFVGAGEIVMRHGLTTGEIAKWFVKNNKLNLDFKVIEMENYKPTAAPGFGWPTGELAWINPSPNASSLNMARFYSGSVLIEGTELSEGRGTSIPLEIIGAPGIDCDKILEKMYSMAPQWMDGAYLRTLYFEPTFHKHTGALCHGFQVHTDTASYNADLFKPFRLTILFLKALHLLYPDFNLWRDFDYEYETERLPFDVINGGPLIREWIEDSNGTINDMESLLSRDETTWQNSIQDCLLY